MPKDSARMPRNDAIKFDAPARSSAARTSAPRRTPVRTPTGSASGNISEQQIRERAYQIYLRRGGKPGDPAADWAQAERELRSSQHG